MEQCVFFWNYDAERTTVSVHLVLTVADGPQLCVLFELVYSKLDFIKNPPVVTVKKRNNFPFAFWNTDVKCRCLSSIRLANQPHLRLKLSNDFRRTIARSVVYNNNFPCRRREILFQRADDRLLDELFVVIRVDEYAN